MLLLDLFLVITLLIWARRLVVNIGSIKRYSIMPLRRWHPENSSPKVSLIIPCRNEAHNLPTLIPSLLAQDYPNLEIILLDDRSTDNTLSIMQSYAKKDPRIRILQGKPLPEGWTGKNHAMHQCAAVAEGEWFLFSDADTEHTPHSVSSSVRYAQERGLDLLTLSARCVCKSFGEHLIQPMGIGCFSVWFQLEKVNDPANETPLACGQYLMIKKSVFDAVGGSQAIKSEVTEDLALFKNVKSAGYHCELAIGSHIFATRMYRSLSEAWNGWRRIYLHAMGKNVPSLLQKVAMLVLFSFSPFLILGISLWQYSAGNIEYRLALILSATLCGFILLLRAISHRTLKTELWPVFLHPISALTIAAIILDGLRHHWTGKKVEWKAQKY